MPRRRSRGVKREHTILEAFEEALERIAALEGVQSVIPGRIAKIRGGAVQEVFVVTDDPEPIRRLVAELEIDG